MICFHFTRKKFLSLSSTGRHRWIIKWLSPIYQQIVTNRISMESLDLFFTSYSDVLAWMEEEKPVKPCRQHHKLWVEFVSDAIHFHRTQANQVVRDQDLFLNIEKNDLGENTRRAPAFDCHMALDGLRSLFNVGSIFRVCDAGGFSSIILGSTPGREDPRVLKTSMQAAQWMPQTPTDNLAETLEIRKNQGYRIVGIETVQGAVPYADYPWQNKTIIVLGNEEYGISSHVLKVCDDFIRIPMFGRKNSLNVATAAAIVVFQAGLHLSA
ncbi:MAG TPA: TrmH family RNA methyltransferase [Desulfobacteraceae bacterium]|nr:TrmH family RNA methyltransferase [Desulfobacteraceae bacterium]